MHVLYNDKRRWCTSFQCYLPLSQVFEIEVRVRGIAMQCKSLGRYVARAIFTLLGGGDVSPAQISLNWGQRQTMTVQSLFNSDHDKLMSET